MSAAKVPFRRCSRIGDFRRTISKSKTKHFLIYEYFILKDDNLISYYKIDENDQIRCCRMEDYMTNDYIIVEAFLVTMFTPGELVHLMVKRNESIENIKTILNRLMTDEVIDISDIDGMRLNNDQTIDVGKRGRLVICKCQWAMEIPFEDCQNMFDRYLMKSNNWSHKMADWNTGLIGEPIDQIAAFEQSMLSVFNTDGILNEHLVNMVSFLQYSRFLCCRSVADYIGQAYEDHWQMDEIFVNISRQTPQQDAMENNFRVSAYLAVLDYVTQLHSASGDLIADNELLAHTIIRKAVKYMMGTFGMNNRFLVRLLISRMGLLANHSDSWIEGAMKCDTTLFNVRYFGCDSSCGISLPIPKNVGTIYGLVMAIGIKTGEVSQRVYLTDMESNIKPKHDDKIDADKLNRYSCFIVANIHDMKKVRLISQGSGGVIYEYRDRESAFVLKRPQSDSDLHREIVVYTILADCVNMIRCLGLVDDDGTICIGMEYKSGASLDEERTSLPEHKIAKLSHQILTQILAMHTRGVIHVDIKPGNIVLDENGNAFLIDFGMSKITHRRSGDSVAIANNSPPGTAWYAAPELINGEPITDKIDTWSFGATLVELTTGKRPYHNLPDFQVMTEISQAKLFPFSFPRGTSQDLIDLIKSCMVPDPRKRASIAELIKSPFLSSYHKSCVLKFV